MSNSRDESTTTANDTAEDSFLRRWSRRKHEARAEQIEARSPASDAPAAMSETILTDADMPPIDSLDEKSDFGMFLSPGVSEALRRKALRKLFTLPSVNQRCPLDSEYYDCHGYEPLGDIVTHEMREEMQRASRQLKEASARVLDDPPATAADAGAKVPAVTVNAVPDAQPLPPLSPTTEDGSS